MQKITKKIGLLLILVLILKLLGVFYRIITTRLLGPEGNRVVSIITPSLSLALATSSLSISSVVTREISINLKTKNVRIRSIMLSALRLVLTSTSIVSLIILASFPLYKYLYQDSFIYFPMLLTIPLLYFSNIAGIMKGYLESNNFFISTYSANIIESTVKLLGTFLLLKLVSNLDIKMQVLIVFFSLMISEMSSCIFLAYRIKKREKIKIDNTYEHYEKNLFSHAIPLTFESLIATIFSYITPFVYYFSCKQNGIDFLESSMEYSMAVSYAIPILLLNDYSTYTITKLSFPSITKNKDNHKNLEQILNLLLLILLITSTISTSLCFYKSELILDILYDNTSTKNIIKYLSPLYFFIAFNPLLSAIHQAFGKEKKLLIITSIAQSIGMILVFLLTYQIKEYSYILGVSIGLFIKSLLLFFSSYKISKIKPSNIIYFECFLIILYLNILNKNNNIIYFFIITLCYFLLSFLLFLYYYKNNIKSLLLHKHK